MPKQIRKEQQFWGNVYGKKKGWNLKEIDGKSVIVTVNKHKIATDAEADAYVRKRANEYHPIYYHDAISIADGDG